MTNHYPLMIPRAKSTDGKLDVFAPFDRSLIATADTADAAAIETALSTADSLYRNKQAWLSVPERIEILERAAEIMQQRFDELAIEAAREGGKPLNDSKVEVARAIDGMKLCIESLRTETGDVIPMGINAASMGRIAFTRAEPIGVVVAVSAFNHPLNLIVHQVAPAIATGCPVIVKPSGETPLSCFRFVEIMREAGLPEEWCQAATIKDRNVSTSLVTDSRVGFFSFIGSAQVGWMLHSKLAPGARAALEHGGVAPVIVEQDADLEDCIPLLAKGGFYHAGQVCVSVQRIYAHESIAETVAERIVTEAGKMSVGDPTLAETDIGPLINPGEVERIHEWVTEAVEAGAKLLCGGKKLSDTCYAPTVLVNPPDDVLVSTGEVFGPVVCVYSYSDTEEAIARANALPVSFQAAVFTKNIDKALEAYAGLNASAVMVNDHTAFRVDWMPFAGLKTSGLGIGGIPHTMHDMQIQKMMVIRSPQI